MDQYWVGIVAMMIPIVAIVAFWAYMIVKSIARSRVRELEIRERIAMIEKGLVPPPEVDPRGFERAMMSRERAHYYGGSIRHRRAGTTLIGVGLGLMLMITFAGESPETGIGVGGFLVMIGLAFLVNGFLEQRQPGEFPSEDRPVAPPMETPKPQ